MIRIMVYGAHVEAVAVEVLPDTPTSWESIRSLIRLGFRVNMEPCDA